MSAVLEVREPGARYLSTPQPLLAREFDLMATARGGVGRLRKLILALAVQGKLVPQDRNDEPAIKSLLRTRLQKDRLIAESSLKMQKADTFVANHETPFDLPAGWQWARLADIVRVLNGRAYAKQELLETGPTPVLRVGNLFTSKSWYYSNLELEADKYCGAGDLLYAWSASFGPFIWSGSKSIFHYHIWKLDPFAPEEFDSLYLHTFLTEKTAELKAAGHGVSMVHLTKEKMERIAVPCPPVAEQARIVARVEELMRLCDVLEAKGRLEAEQHARLLSTLLGTLTDSASPDELATNWHRVAAHFDLLLDRPEAVDALEQTIMQLAVQGVLVPQRANEEPAALVLRRLNERRLALAPKAVPISAQLAWPNVDWPPYNLPSGWQWSTAQELCSPEGGAITYGILKPEWVVSGVLTVRVQDMQGGELLVHAVGHCLPERAAKFKKTTLKEGDLLIAKDGATLGKTAFVPKALEGGNITQHVLRFPIAHLLNSAYVRLVIDSSHGQGWMRGETQGVALPGVNVGDFRRMPVPVPPVAEQGRIVERVSELRRLCTDLRQRLAASQITQTHLAEALVESAIA